MGLGDIVVVSIDDHMRDLARLDQEFFKRNWGSKTRDAYDDRDYIGSLAHQAVEAKFAEMGLPYTGYRAVRMQLGQGDKCDIEYEGDTIDVKGYHGTLNKTYFYNRQFLIFSDQIFDSKIKQISHFCFVEVDDCAGEAYIYGIMHQNDFIDKSVDVELKYKNRGIRAYQLKPFYNYIYHV